MVRDSNKMEYNFFFVRWRRHKAQEDERRKHSKT
jgi:hypothetical protein